MRTKDLIPAGMWENAVEGCTISSKKISRRVAAVQHQLELADNARTQRSVELLRVRLGELLKEVHRTTGRDTVEDARLAILGYFTSKLLHDVEETIEKLWPEPEYW